MATPSEAVIGLDMGSSSIKAAVFRPDGTPSGSATREHPLSVRHPGWAEQDPARLVDLAMECIAEAAVIARRHDVTIAGLGLSVPMHTLVGLDDGGSPVTPLITFADSRAQAQADRLRRDHMDLYRATGTPLHPMSPLATLVWFREQAPEVAARVATWVSLKEVLVAALTGRVAVDHATASATGLYNLRGRDWDPTALDLAGITPAQLAPLVPIDHVVGSLVAAAAARTGLSASTPVVIGASDGVLANVGVGAGTDAGVGAVTIGTSGAVRVTVDEPMSDRDMRLFCCAQDTHHWVVGGAINNGGLWLRWLREHVFGRDVAIADMDGLATGVPAGSDGVVVLPWLTGERAPDHATGRTGVVAGLRFDHGRGHLVRAGMEGVAHQLRLVADALTDAGLFNHRDRGPGAAEHAGGVTCLRATGGFTKSSVWLQVVADVLELPLEVPTVAEPVAFGAAAVAMAALDLVPGVDAVVDTLEVERRVTPDETTRSVHAQTRVRRARLVAALGTLDDAPGESA